MDANDNYLSIAEVLFSLFGVLDPLSIDRLRVVCKQWDQMSRDQELWRQFCLKRWKNLPKDSDCAKNWIIPSEGKEKKRIDWKRVYIIRDLSDRISDYLREVIIATTPQHRRSAFFMNKKKIKDFFAKGWIEAKQLVPWGDQLKKILFKLILDENNDFPMDKLYSMLIDLLDFHLEMELVMVKQAKLSNTKKLGFASYFLHESKFIFRGISSLTLVKLSKRLLRSATQYVEAAKANEIPISNVGEHLHGLAGIFSLLDAKHSTFVESVPDLAEFIKLVLHCIDTWPVENEFNEWISENIDETQEHFPSPTYDLDQCFSELSIRIQLLMSKDVKFLENLLVDFKITNPIPIMALICFLAPACRGLFLEHLDEFMDKYFKPYFKVSSDPKDLIPMFYYYQNVVNQFADELCSKYADSFFPVIITAARVNHVKVNGYVCSTIFNLCRMISDPKALLPYMENLLDALFPLLRSSNTDVREGAVSSITSLLTRTKEEFHRFQDRVMREFMELSQRSKSDQQAVFEELGRLSASLGNHGGALGTLIEKRFDEIIEDFKRDRPANERSLLNLAGCAAVTLGKNFSKYLTTVMPLVLELAMPNIEDGDDEDIEEIQEANPENEDDIMDVEEDENINDDDKEDNNENDEIANFGREDSKRTELREKALETLGLLLELPREDMLPYFQEIGNVLSTNLESEQDLDILILCINDYADYTHLFFTKDADEEFLNGIRTFAEHATNLFSAALINIEDYDRKNTLNIETRIVEQFTDILNILKNASKTPLFGPEFVSPVIELFMLAYTNLSGRADDDFQANSDLANQIVTLFEVILRNAVDKKDVLEDMADFFEEMLTTLNEPCEARWTEICLLAEMIEVVGELPNQEDLIPLFSQCLWECRNIDSDMIQQSVACTFGIIFRKFSESTLATKKELNDWLLTLLNDEYRVKRPYVYDNALLTLGLFVSKDSNIDRILTFAKKFPPARDGDRHEIPKIVTMLLTLSEQHKEVILKNEQLRSEIIRALKATLALENYTSILPIEHINSVLAMLN